jgi:hypothetical protein
LTPSMTLPFSKGKRWKTPPSKPAQPREPSKTAALGANWLRSTPSVFLKVQSIPIRIRKLINRNLNFSSKSFKATIPLILQPFP